MRARRRGTEREPTIALINIVFLMLIFFLVAGTMARPLDPDLSLVKTRDLDRAPPADALVLHADGRLSFRGEDLAEAADVMPLLDAALGETARDKVRIVPDRDAPAARLVAVGRALRDAGAERVVVVTERGLE